MLTIKSMSLWVEAGATLALACSATAAMQAQIDTELLPNEELA